MNIGGIDQGFWPGNLKDGIISFAMPGGYVGLGDHDINITVSGLAEALSLFGEEAAVAWDRDVAPFLPSGGYREPVAGCIWPGHPTDVGSIWLGRPRPWFKFVRNERIWIDRS